MEEYQSVLNCTDQEIDNVIKAFDGKFNPTSLTIFLLFSNERLKRKVEKLEKVISNQSEDTFW